MKNIFLSFLLVGAVVSVSSFAKADPGMPKSFNLLMGVGGPVVTGQLSEIQLSRLKLSKDQVCGSETTYDYLGPALHLTVGGEEYVMDVATSIMIDFNTDTCAMNSQNISGLLLKFDHTKMNVSVGVEIDMVHGFFRILSRDIGSASGMITSKY